MNGPISTTVPAATQPTGMDPLTQDGAVRPVMAEA
jgi:hypothetical protein